MIAAIDERVEHEKQKAKELQRKNRRGGKGRKPTGSDGTKHPGS